MDEAEALSDLVAVMGAGRILARGTVEQLRERSRNRYKATLPGENGGPGQAVLGSSYEDVVAELRRLGVREYAIAKTSLEDLYLELTGEAMEE